MHRVFLLAAISAATVLVLPVAPAQAQSNCDALLNQKITASGPILRIIDLEVFIDSVMFRDSKSGCQLVLLEGLLNPGCEEGKTITVTGVVTRNALSKGLEIEPASSGSARCR